MLSTRFSVSTQVYVYIGLNTTIVLRQTITLVGVVSRTSPPCLVERSLRCRSGSSGGGEVVGK